VSDQGGLQLSLPARAENVAVVRHAISGLAEAIGMEATAVADLKTVVTEACMNVVLHAYEDGGEGPLEVIAEPDSQGLTVVVRDHGSGIRPRAEIERTSLRLGLALIAALSDSFEIRGAAGEGTEVRMRLALSANGHAAPASHPTAREAMRKGAVIAVSEKELVAPVLSRVLSMYAARTELSVDRLSDAMLLGDAISAYAPRAFADGKVQLEIEDGDGTVEMRIGPMVGGSGQQLRDRLAVPEIKSSLEMLADEVTLERRDEGEYLSLRVTGPPA
jgi:anti-sigma regulatory factor (Ser/Thr protein kinase)